MTKPVVLIGAGGHATVLAEMLAENSIPIRAIVSPNAPTAPNLMNIERIETDDQFVQTWAPGSCILVNGIGSIPGSNLRARLGKMLSDQGYVFSSVLSSHAYIPKGATLAAGVQVMAGAVVQTGTQVGENSILNSGCIIDHDCHIGSYCHVAPSATLSGDTVVEDNVHIGTGASLIQGISVGSNSVVGAGAVITKNIPPQTTVVGTNRILR